MKKRRLFRIIKVPLVMIVATLGLLTACADRESNDMENGISEMQSNQQRVTEMQPDSTKENNETFKATLKGSNEVSPVQTEAEGDFTVTIQGDSIHVSGEFSGLGSEYTASHLHKGAKGNNGNPVLTLSPNISTDRNSGSWDDNYKLEKPQLSALKAGSLYVNVHSTKFKAGEIRGQLTSASDSDTTRTDSEL